MAFQLLVRLVQTLGIIGEIIFGGPLRVRPANLKSVTTENTVGKAFTWDSTVDGEAGAGAIGGGAFAGILIHPKHYALKGATLDTLAASLDLPDNSIGEL